MDPISSSLLCNGDILNSKEVLSRILARNEISRILGWRWCRGINRIVEGALPCPVCKIGRMWFFRSPANQHACCSSPGCISFMD